ncbi:MAG TPA: BON domain-containing protein [Bryobacteraceae bacterium]|jgi:hyperosmotically inducible protein|nr:BON domain-containing protein [Bryobacteraceae bacterium]
MKYKLLTLAIAGTLAGCSSMQKSPDVADSIRKSLDQSGYKDVSVSEDRDKGVVKLTGHVSLDNDKVQAEQMARSLAPGQVIADEIIVLPAGAESAAKAVNADVDTAIGKLFDAALIQNRLHDSVKYSVKSGVVTLTGEVHSQADRVATQNLAAAVPNVQQVVNELQVKDQKATGSN